MLNCKNYKEEERKTKNIKTFNFFHFQASVLNLVVNTTIFHIICCSSYSDASVMI